MDFFDGSSRGMVISRFSSDIDTIDKKVSRGFQLSTILTLDGKYPITHITTTCSNYTI